MKTLSILVLLLLVGACREEEGIWDKLTPEEKEALQLRASLKCLDDEKDDIEDIIDRSNKNLSDLCRLDTWEISTTQETNKIHVFKTTSTHVYFLYRQSDAVGTFSKFIKVPIAQNTEQYTDLQRKKCAVVVTGTAGDPKYTSASLSNSTFNGNYEKPKVFDNDTYYIETLTNTYSKEFPAVFGILSKTRVKKTYNKKTDVLTKTDTYKWTIKRADDISDSSLSLDYRTFSEARFCIAKYRPSTGPTAPIYYPIPGLDENALNCTALAAGPDANGDGVSDFDPAVDMPPPTI